MNGILAPLARQPSGLRNLEIEGIAPIRPEPAQPAVLAIAGLPETGYERLVGRDAELKRLDEAWSDGKTAILSLIAEGGAGKSALVNEWLKRLRADFYRGARGRARLVVLQPGIEGARDGRRRISQLGS